jgi:putative hemolysin
MLSRECAARRARELSVNWSEVGILLALILLNGFFAASELALVSARKPRLRARADAGSRRARVALRLLEDPTRLLSSIQIGITLISILTGVYSGSRFAEALAARLVTVEWLAAYASEVAYTLVVIVITYLSLILGELVPKRFAMLHADTLAIWVAPAMDALQKAFAPLVWALRAVTDGLVKLMPVSAAPAESVTEDDVRALIAEGARHGVFEHRERDMVESVLRLADRSVRSVMIPRGDVLWLDANEPVQRLWDEARSSGHTRFLLCDGLLDNLVGIVSLGSLGEAVRRGRLDPQADATPPLSVPESSSVLQLLEQFRNDTSHLAVVTDEYGTIEGIATPIDILRAIAGGLPDSGSRDEAESVQRDDGSWLVDGHMPIHDVERALGRADLTAGDAYQTLGGFVLWHLGRIPRAGDTLEWRDLRLEVMDMDGRRIDKVLVRTVPRSATESGEEAD